MSHMIAQQMVNIRIMAHLNVQNGPWQREIFDWDNEKGCFCIKRFLVFCWTSCLSSLTMVTSQLLSLLWNMQDSDNSLQASVQLKSAQTCTKKNNLWLKITLIHAVHWWVTDSRLKTFEWWKHFKEGHKWPGSSFQWTFSKWIAWSKSYDFACY